MQNFRSKTMMYQVQQPTRLEDLAIQALARWIIIPIQKMLPTLAEFPAQNNIKASTLLSRHIESIRYRLQCNVSRELHDKLAAVMIKTLAILLEDPKLSAKIEEDGYRWLNRELLILGRVIKTIFTKHLTSLTVDIREINEKVADMFITSICSYPQFLRNLVRFDLIMDVKTSAFNKTLLEDIVPVFKELINLMYVSLDGTFCTPEILQSLTDNCKGIEELKLFSHDIITTTRETMIHIKSLPQLKYFKCKGICFPYKDITKELLMACANIEYIDIEQVTSPYYSSKYPLEDNIGEAVREIISENYNEKKFNLKYYRLNYEAEPEPSQNIELLTQTCPMLSEIWLASYGIESEEKQNIFRIFPNLTRLKLKSFYIYKHKILDMLLIKGRNLVELHLKSVYEVDLNALIVISEICPNLENLYLNSCGFLKSKRYSCTYGEIDDLNNPPFLNLKRLSMSGHCMPTNGAFNDILEPLIYFLLVNSPNVEYVSFGSLFGEVIMRDIITKVLDRNPLIHLKEFYSVSSSELTELSIDRLIQNNADPAGVLVIKSGRQKKHKYYYERKMKKILILDDS